MFDFFQLKKLSTSLYLMYSIDQSVIPIISRHVVYVLTTFHLDTIWCRRQLLSSVVSDKMTKVNWKNRVNQSSL